MGKLTKKQRTKRNRQRMLVVGLVAGFVGLLGIGLTFAAPEKPNVIVFFTDDMRTDELKFMEATQRLIRQEGAKFGRAYSNNPLCCPFRAVALTGQHTHNNGVYSNGADKHGGVTFLNQDKTLPPNLQKQGYQTAYIGKYLNGYGGDKDAATVPKGYDEWHVSYNGIYSYDNVSVNHNGTSTQNYKGQNVADVYANLTNQTIRDFAQKDKPFVMYVSHLAPHYRIADGSKSHYNDPLPPERYKGVVKASDLPPIVYENNVGDKPKWIRALKPVSAAKKQRLTQHRIARAESLMAVDDAVESMVQTLQQTGQLDNTIILFTSDNGYLLGEHRVDNGKILPYEVSAGIPMLVRGPGFAPGSTRSDVVGSVDIGATILDLTGTTVPYKIDGKSLTVVDNSRKMLLEAAPRSMRGVDDSRTWMYSAVVSRTWKYIRNYNGEKELYMMNTAQGRKELSSQAKKNPYVVQKYEALRRQLKNCAGSACNIQ